MLADIGAGRGERIVLADEPHRVGAASLAHQRHIAGHVHPGGTQGHAGHGQLQAGETAMMFHVLLIVIPEALQPVQHQPRRVASDGAVGGVQDAAGRLLDNGDGIHRPRAVQHGGDELAELSQADAAGHALAAGLGVAQLQKRQGHIHRAQARRTGGDTALHIAVEVIHHRLGAAGILDVKPAQGQGLLSSMRRSAIRLYWVIKRMAQNAEKVNGNREFYSYKESLFHF